MLYAMHRWDTITLYALLYSWFRIQSCCMLCCMHDWDTITLYAMLYSWFGIQSCCMLCCMHDWDTVMLYAMLYAGLGYKHVVYSVVCMVGIQCDILRQLQCTNVRWKK